MLNLNDTSEPGTFDLNRDDAPGNTVATCEFEYDVIGEYLDRVCAPLVGIVPRSKRQEVRSTVRRRLVQLVTTHMAAGMTPDEAVSIALAKCGEPKQISRRWLPDPNGALLNNAAASNTRFKIVDRHDSSCRVATAIAGVAFGLPYAALVAYSSSHSTSSVVWSVACVRALLFATPLLAGMITGLAARQKPVRGVLNAMGILAIPAIAIPGFALCLSVTKFGPDPTDYLLTALGIEFIVPWLVLGVSGAAIGMRFRKVGKRVARRVSRVLRTAA